MASRTKEQDGEYRRSQYERQGHDDPSCCRGPARRCNGQFPALELSPLLYHRRNGQAVTLDLVSRLRPGRGRGGRFWPSCVSVRVNKGHAGDETIAAFWQRFDISRILCRVS